jgi:hypothetical protein
VRTTLTLDEDVYAALQREARLTGKPFKAVTNEILRHGLLERSRPTPVRRFKVVARDLRLKAGYSLDSISQLIEQVDGPGYK